MTPRQLAYKSRFWSSDSIPSHSIRSVDLSLLMDLAC